MIFNSLAFAVFLPFVFLLYWALPHKCRWVFLLAASYYFYMSGDAYYGVMLAVTTAATYVCARQIERCQSERARKVFLWLGAAAPIGALFFFKYFAFAMETITYLARAVSIPMDEFVLRVIMPLGISFYTFKAVGYVVDVYRGRQQAERHFSYYACFLAYFPDVISGPIDRAEILLPQLKAKKRFRYEDGVYALRLMLLGFAKKLLLADALTKYTDMIFNEVTHYSGFTLVFASFLFTIQIYCDFSGYSDIARGVSKLFGIELMQNFTAPYFARSLKEFWGSWHISLSTWFRDYVYIPLGGGRVSKPRRALNTMATFLVSGLWHGADYTYLLWGGIHGLYRIVENGYRDLTAGRRSGKTSLDGSMPSHDIVPSNDRHKTITALLQTAVTFILVDFAWIFFRSNGLRGAFYFVTHMFSDVSFGKAMADMDMSVWNLAKIGSFMLALAVYDYYSRKKDLLREMDRLPAIIRWGLYFGMTLLIAVIKIHNGTSQQFIYFQF